MRIQEKIAGPNATGNKDRVIGVELRAFVASKRMTGGQTLHTDVMALSAEKKCTNVLYNQVSKIFEVLTQSAMFIFSINIISVFLSIFFISCSSCCKSTSQ